MPDISVNRRGAPNVTIESLSRDLKENAESNPHKPVHVSASIFKSDIKLKQKDDNSQQTFSNNKKDLSRFLRQVRMDDSLRSKIGHRLIELRNNKTDLNWVNFSNLIEENSVSKEEKSFSNEEISFSNMADRYEPKGDIREIFENTFGKYFILDQGNQKKFDKCKVTYLGDVDIDDFDSKNNFGKYNTSYPEETDSGFVFNMETKSSEQRLATTSLISCNPIIAFLSRPDKPKRGVLTHVGNLTDTKNAMIEINKFERDGYTVDSVTVVIKANQPHPRQKVSAVWLHDVAREMNWPFNEVILSTSKILWVTADPESSEINIGHYSMSS